jgi:GNAT superfamily N-acetyltransferase
VRNDAGCVVRSIGPNYRAEHVLSDGTRIVVRPIRPEDATELRRAFESLSPQSRYRRFFGAVDSLSDATLEYLTRVDGEDHFALVAGTESPDLKRELGVGVARFIRLADDPEVAEAAVTVVDGMQRQGVGRILLTTLAQAARERGIRRFRASVLANNAPMRHIAEEIGAAMRRDDDETLSMEIELGGATEGHDSTLKRLFREAAASMAVLVRNFRPPSA